MIDTNSEYYINVYVILNETTSWGKAGHTIAEEQFIIQTPATTAHASKSSGTIMLAADKTGYVSQLIILKQFSIQMKRA